MNMETWASMKMIYERLVLCCLAFNTVLLASYRLFYLIDKSNLTTFSYNFFTFFESVDLSI